MTTLTLRRSTRLFTAAASVAGALIAGSAAFAGECPAGDKAVDAIKTGPMKPVGVTDTELASVALAKEEVKLDGRRLRIRKLVVQPGGVVPWHNHADRPALIYILSGSITEYASNCTAPIEHKAGEVSREFNGVAHWWKNNGKVPAVLTSSDIVHDKDDQHVM